MSFRFHLAPMLACCLLVACSSTTQQGAIGVDRKQLLLVSSEEVNQAAAQAYTGELQQASQAGKLNDDKQMVERVRAVASRLIPQTAVFRPDALQWKWEVNVETSPELNAYCAPGGKIMFYTGIISKLNLSDAEIAAIMGHEMSHALREHGRERMSEAVIQQLGLQAGSSLLGLENKQQQLQLASNLLFTLPHSRGQEAEADEMGLELMARAGYDPHAAISLWKKMAQAGAGGGVAILSTHPTGPQRISDLEALMPKVMPLYEKAKGQPGGMPAPAVPKQ